jgi:anti-sigma B factor antagonist
MAFSVDINEQNGSTIFLLKGKLMNEGDSLTLNDTIDEEIEAGNHNIIFDLSQLEICNSSGLNVMIRTLTKARTKNGDAVVCSINSSLNKMFMITKLNEIFNLFPNQKEAINHFKK